MASSDREPWLPVGLLLAWFAITMSLWAMAFYQAPTATPEWLLRARSACFGTSQSGLPDTYGWMVLSLGPLSMLAGLLVALGGEVRRGLATLAASRAGTGLLVVLLATATGEAAWLRGRIEAGIAVATTDYALVRPEGLPPDYPRLNQEAAPFALTDQHGRRISPGDWPGRVVFLTFAYAHCRTVCPVILDNVLRAVDRLPAARVAVLVVTLDPWRDTPRSLPALARQWHLGENAHVLSGTVEEVTQVLDAYRVPRQRDGQTGDVTHPALVYLLDQEGRIAYGFNNPHADWLTAAAQRLFQLDDRLAHGRG